MTTRQLSEELGVTPAEVRRWVRKGLPHRRDHRGHYTFQPAKVRTWLIAEGLAEEPAPAPTPQLAASLSEVAAHFDVSDRAVGYWRAHGMPGTRGAYDLDAIDQWRATSQVGRMSGPGTDEARARLLQTKAEAEEIKLARLKGELVELRAVVRWYRRHINDVKSQLDQLPERVLAILPESIEPETQRTTQRALRRLVDDLYTQLADATEFREEEEGEEEVGSGQ